MAWYGVEYLVNLFEMFLFSDFIEKNKVRQTSTLKKFMILICGSILLMTLNVLGQSNLIIAQNTFIVAAIILFMIHKLLMRQSIKQAIFDIIQFYVILLLSDIITVGIMGTLANVEVASILEQSSDRLIAMVFSKTITLYLIRVFKGLRSSREFESKTSVLVIYTGLFIINTILSITMIYLFKWSAGHELLELYIFLGSVGILSVNIFILFFSKFMEDSNKKEQDNLRLAQQNMYYEKYIEDVEASREAFHKLYHNYKHDIQCISGLTLNESYEDLKKYITSINKSLEETEFVNYSCPMPLNALLNAKMDSAERKNVALDLDVFMPAETEIDDYDLCNIVGNILDNGIEACAYLEDGKKTLTLEIYIQKKMLFINSTNPIGNEVIYAQNKIVTTKDNKILHGHGLNIINDIATKYGGYSIINAKSKIFDILVAIPYK